MMLEVRIMEGGTVHLLGRFDASQAAAARQALSGVDRSVTFDLSELEYISSAGLGVLIEVYKRLHGKGQTMRLVKLRPNVKAVFGFAGLEKVLTIE
ncbi:MAG TPA: STAS domain-containing protein [Candidatus Eisenbacteria bacterium]|nr:STAS domain-containing protein [Candidatus Eisenbacteria bacterium]